MCSACQGDYEDPNETQDETEDTVQPEVMTTELAKQRNLSVYTFSRHSEGTRAAFAAGRRAQGLEVFVYDEPFQAAGLTFKFLCVAVGPRRNAGETARTVKKFSKS
jgi:hypothetical protein